MNPRSPSHTTMPVTQARRLIDGLHGKLIVSCQAPPGDPLRPAQHMAAMAASVAAAPIAAVRAQGADDVAAIRATVDLPLIGLWKDGADGVYITPTPAHARGMVEAGADVIAIDATERERPDGRELTDTIELVHRLGSLLMADVSTVDEGVTAQELGADLVSTTLAGYTPYSRQGPEPDLELVAELAARLEVPIIAEGRLRTPEHASAAMEAGAWAVVVGSAITAPAAIAERFAAALPTQ